MAVKAEIIGNVARIEGLNSVSLPEKNKEKVESINKGSGVPNFLKNSLGKISSTCKGREQSSFRSCQKKLATCLPMRDDEEKFGECLKKGVEQLNT